MMRVRSIQSLRWGLWLLLCAAALGMTVRAATDRETALDRYVARPDPTYAWKLVNTISGDGYKGYVLELTSQRWRTEAEVD